jgi:hypothetical protein
MEALELQHTPEIRKIERSDDPLFNYRYLREHMTANGEFESQAEEEVLQNIYSEIAESNIRHHVPVVEHPRHSESGRFMAFGRSTIQNAIIGLNAVEVVDETSRNQFLRSQIELEDEVKHNRLEVLEQLADSHVSLFLSPAPTQDEMDLKLGRERYGYDGRTMIRIQNVSQDSMTKYMYSASVFGVPIEAVAKFQAERGVAPADNTALAVMESSSTSGLIEGTPQQVLYDTLTGISKYCDPETADKILKQRDAFTMDQEELEDIAHLYASEEVEFLKELALAHGSVARGKGAELLDNLRLQSSDHLRGVIDFHRQPADRGYLISNELVPIALGLKQETTRNRASLATGDIEITEKLEKKLGKERTYQVASAELSLIKLDVSGESSLGGGITRSANELAMAEANVGCGDGCPTKLNGQFDAKVAEANSLGIFGDVYHIEGGVNGHKCAKAHKGKGVYMNGKGKAVCLNCGESNHGGGDRGKDYAKAKQKALMYSQAKRQARQQRLANRQRYNKGMGFLDYVIHGEQKVE